MVIQFPETAPGESIAVSATLFVTYRACPQQALGRLRGAYPSDSVASFRGSLAHRIFARHLVSGPIPDGDLLQVCREEIGAPDGRLLFIVRAHPSILYKETLSGSGEWRSAITSILSGTEKLLDTSGQIDRDLETLVETFRKRMNLLSKIGQTFSAFLNVLPATVAVTYILSTGDPVGAAGIKVKLSGLFGLKDLYALVALPATSGLRTADQVQLEALIGPIAETWLNHKLEVIQTIFQDTISGETLAKSKRIYLEADRHITDLNRVLVNCRAYASHVVGSRR